jgi:hypothetical protein
MPNPSQVTIIIPVSSYHQQVADRAIASVREQTVPCALVRVDDPDGNGPSWARNRGLEIATTPFVVFLDADDWLEPTFVERCLAVWKPDHYVYTDWFEDNTVKEAPLDAWCGNGAWHCITTLLPKYAADMVGGFTSLPGAEDTEFYWAITRKHKICGIRLAEPLFHYGEHGKRAKSFVESAQYPVVMQSIIGMYGNMSCCTDQIVKANLETSGDKQPGDVLVRAIWGGNQVKMGTATGRMYPRGGNGSLMYVDPADARAKPSWWQIVNAPIEAPSNGYHPPVPIARGIMDFVRVIAPNAKQTQATLQDLQQVQATHSAPNFGRVAELARRAYA